MALDVILTGKDILAGVVTTIDDVNTTITYYTFPSDTRIGTMTTNANVRRLYALGFRNFRDAIIQKFEGSIGIDTPLFDATFVSDLLTKEVFGDLLIRYPSYARLIHDFVPQRVEISVREDEMVRVSVDGLYASEEKTTYSLSPIPPASELYPTHVNTTITTVDGITNVTIRSATIRVNLNNELKWGIGSRTASAVIPKQIEVEVSIEAILDTSMIDKIVADSQTPVTITFTINVDSTTITITVSDAYLDSLSVPTEPNAEVYATLNYVAKSVSVS